MNVLGYSLIDRRIFALVCTLASILLQPFSVYAMTDTQKRIEQFARESRPEFYKALREKEESKQATELEAVFLQKMLEQAFPQGDGSNMALFGGGPGNGVFRSMYIEQVARSWAKQGGVGLADDILKQTHSRRGDRASVAKPKTYRSRDLYRFENGELAYGKGERQ